MAKVIDERKHLIGSIRGLGQDRRGGEDGGEQAGRHGAAEADELISEVRVADREQGIGPSVGFGNIKAHLVGHSSSNKVTPFTPSQTVPLSGHQIFKYMTLLGPFSLKLPQELSLMV